MSDDSKAFWDAVQNGDVETVKRLLESDNSLAGKNFNLDSKHTDGFPLYQATKRPNFEMTKLLLEAGADPDAALDTNDPREVGMPLINALECGRLDIVNLILDYNPALNAYPYCSTPFVDCLFNNLWDTTRTYQSGEVWRYKNGLGREVSNLFRSSFSSQYNCQPPQNVELNQDAPKELPEFTLLRRVIGMGGVPSFFTLVRHQQTDLIKELLRASPNEKGTLMDWPQGTVFKNIRGTSAWCGYPETARFCIELCSELYTPDVARHAIESAIRSHNRDGGIDQYFELIDMQLKFLEGKQVLLNGQYDNGEPFTPLHWLADDFIEPKNYGFKCQPLSTEDDLIRLAQLFLDYGFDINATDSKTNKTTLEIASGKKLERVVSFLIEHGATNEG
jgi:ankyrin repeat protein